MASLDTFLTRVLPRAMGAADPVARLAIVDAAIEFCEETGVVQAVLTPLNVVAGTPNYTLSLPTATAVTTVRKGWYQSKPLGAASDDSIANVLAYHDSVGDDEAPTGPPVEYFWLAGQVWVYPIPDESKTAALAFRVALKPELEATVLPDELLTNWRDAIVAGAVARLTSQRGTSHYDMQTAGMAATQFATAKNRARIMARTGRASGDMRVTMRPFA